jgi:hypothetical protein
MQTLAKNLLPLLKEVRKKIFPNVSYDIVFITTIVKGVS